MEDLIKPIIEGVMDSFDLKRERLVTPYLDEDGNAADGRAAIAEAMYIADMVVDLAKGQGVYSKHQLLNALVHPCARRGIDWASLERAMRFSVLRPTACRIDTFEALLHSVTDRPLLARLGHDSLKDRVIGIYGKPVSHSKHDFYQYSTFVGPMVSEVIDAQEVDGYVGVLALLDEKYLSWHPVMEGLSHALGRIAESVGGPLPHFQGEEIVYLAKDVPTPLADVFDRTRRLCTISDAGFGWEV